MVKEDVGGRRSGPPPLVAVSLKSATIENFYRGQLFCDLCPSKSNAVVFGRSIARGFISLGFWSASLAGASLRSVSLPETGQAPVVGKRILFSGFGMVVIFD